MRYFRVEGDTSLPFYIPKITMQHARLLEKRVMQPQSLLPDAERHLLAVQSACTRWAKEFGTPLSTEICLRSCTAHASAFIPLWNLRRKDLEILQELRPHLVGITARPFAFGLKLLFKVRYFPCPTSSIDKDLEKILKEYAEK